MPAGRALLGEFASALAAWEWDVALLQEVPPWWPAPLAAACGASERHVLTSRNALLPLRRAIARRAPDLIKSNGGGGNAILVRGRAIADQRALRLAWLPERRWAHGVRLAGGGWIVNLHATTRDEPRALVESERAVAAARGWAGGEPLLVLGGDLNIAQGPALPGLRHLVGHHVDHLYGEGEPHDAAVLERGRLSDHAPIAVSVLSP